MIQIPLDIDELINSSLCFGGDSCKNTMGNYLCHCRAGYSWNGTFSKGELVVKSHMPPVCIRHGYNKSPASINEIHYTLAIYLSFHTNPYVDLVHIPHLYGYG